MELGENIATYIIMLSALYALSNLMFTTQQAVAVFLHFADDDI